MWPQGQWKASKKIAWEGDIYIYKQTLRLLDRIGPVGQFGENVPLMIIRACSNKVVFWTGDWQSVVPATNRLLYLPWQHWPGAGLLFEAGGWLIHCFHGWWGCAWPISHSLVRNPPASWPSPIEDGWQHCEWQQMHGKKFQHESHAVKGPCSPPGARH